MANISQIFKQPLFSICIAGKKIGFCFCHHQPKRTIQCFGLQNYFCSRCQGILIGTIFSIPIGIYIYSATVLDILLLSLPLLLDGILQIVHDKESTNFIRFISGLCLAMGLTGVWTIA